MGNNRKPKLFFVSSASTTSTIKTDTVCYMSSNTAISAACTKRRKRAFMSEGMFNVPEVQPSDVESGMDDSFRGEARQVPLVLVDNNIDIIHHRIHQNSDPLQRCLHPIWRQHMWLMIL